MVGPILTLDLIGSTYQPVQFALFHLRALSSARLDMPALLQTRLHRATTSSGKRAHHELEELPRDGAPARSLDRGAVRAERGGPTGHAA